MFTAAMFDYWVLCYDSNDTLFQYLRNVSLCLYAVENDRQNCLA